MVDMFWKDTCNVVTWNGAHLCKHHKTISGEIIIYIRKT